MWYTNEKIDKANTHGQSQHYLTLKNTKENYLALKKKIMKFY